MFSDHIDPFPFPFFSFSFFLYFLEVDPNPQLLLTFYEYYVTGIGIIYVQCDLISIPGNKCISLCIHIVLFMNTLGA